MKFLYFYSEKVKPRTWLNALSLKDKYDIEFELTTINDDYSYYHALSKYWMSDDLVILEQDILFTEAMLVSLRDCPRKACTYYHLGNSKDYIGNALTIGARVAEPKYMLVYPRDWHANDQIPDWCTFTGSGCMKISKEMQMKPMEKFRMMTKANGMNGLNADNAIINNINTSLWDTIVRFHIHGYAEHYGIA